MLKWYLTGFAVLFLIASTGAAKYLYDQNQTLKTQIALLEAANAKITSQANRYANKPKSDADTVNRLRKWAADTKRSEAKSK